MPSHFPEDHDGTESRVFSDADAARLFLRATEVEAERSGFTAAELRVAAAEAGISLPAFDAALAEQQQPVGEPSPPHRRPRRAHRRTWLLGAIGLATVGIASILMTSRPPTESVLVQCDTDRQTAALLREQIEERRRNPTASPETPETQKFMQEVLEDYEQRLLSCPVLPARQAASVPS